MAQSSQSERTVAAVAGINDEVKVGSKSNQINEIQWVVDASDMEVIESTGLNTRSGKVNGSTKK